MPENRAAYEQLAAILDASDDAIIGVTLVKKMENELNVPAK